MEMPRIHLETATRRVENLQFHADITENNPKMARNDYSHMPHAELRVLAGQMAASIGADPAAYGATSGQITQLNAMRDEFAADLIDVAMAKATLRSLVCKQNADKTSLVDLVALLARQMYNVPGISDAKVVETGLAVRDRVRSRVEPVMPTKLTATPSADSSVTLKWGKENPYGVLYIVEASVAGGEWTQVFATKRGKVALHGFKPGVPTLFRVRASNNGVMSPPSNAVAIYPESSALSCIKIAA